MMMMMMTKHIIMVAKNEKLVVQFSEIERSTMNE